MTLAIRLLDTLRRLKASTEPLNYGRHIVTRWALEVAAETAGDLRILDVGLGVGTDILNVRNAVQKAFPKLHLDLHGIENYDPNVQAAKKNHISVAAIDIERSTFPYTDGYFDLVISNQTIEHTKEIFWIYSEISRVLKPGGYVITGVPNLASLHNRVALLFGMQPTSIELLGPHVRGFTLGAFIRFIEADGYFKNVAYAGSNFYPFPLVAAEFLSRLFPRMSVSFFAKAQRTSKASTFIQVLQQRFFETPYFTGLVNKK